MKFRIEKRGGRYRVLSKRGLFSRWQYEGNDIDYACAEQLMRQLIKIECERVQPVTIVFQTDITKLLKNAKKGI